MKALTLYASWAHAIAHGSKRVENRTWHPPKALLGHRLAIHAGKTLDADGLEAIEEIDGTTVPPPSVARSAIVATANLVRSVEFHGLFIPKDVDEVVRSDWWAGPVGWVLDDVRPLRVPVPCKGAQGLWDLPRDVESAVEHQVETTHVLVGGQVLHVHRRADCDGPPCPIHHPTDHHMRAWTQNWRADTRVLERICPHGVGHPDPDQKTAGVHGCDGCCRRPT